MGFSPYLHLFLSGDWRLSRFVLLACCAAFCAVGAKGRAKDAPHRVDTNRVAEWAFVSGKAYADPFHEVTLDVVFTAPDGTRSRVPAFWAGGQTWKVRYASGQTGQHHFRTECSDTSNSDLHGKEGALTIMPYRGRNPLYRHGPLRVAPDHRHFTQADGTPFLWLGDTWWMGLSARLSWPEFQTLAADRKAKGFNVVQIVAGLYPEMAPLDPRTANEGGLPWTADFGAIRPEYFDAADRRLQYLIDQEFTPCIVGAWGYFLPVMGQEKMRQHWRYLIARYGAYPVVWCVAGEANLPYYKVANFPFEDQEQVRGWTEICRYVHQADPFGRVLTVHPTGLGKLTSRYSVTDQSVLGYDMLQTGHGGMNDYAVTLKTVRASYAATPTLPVVQSEVNYEAILGPDYNNAALQRLFVWTCLLEGATGYTYGGNGIWQVNRAGEKQVTFGNYPTPTWQEAMNLPGAAQVGLARKLLERYAWQRFTPHPEWASYDANAPLDLAGSAWIWFPEGAPAQNAPTEKRYFRRAFVVPTEKNTEKNVVSARLKISADDAFTAYLNGQEIGTGKNWRAGRQFSDLARLLRPGRNVLAVAAENIAANVPNNPAGLIAKLEIKYADGSVETLVSDASWSVARSDKSENQASAKLASGSNPNGSDDTKTNGSEASDWRSAAFDDSGWAAALPVAAYGQPPWGQAGSGDTPLSPLCAGIPGEVRMIYLPHAGRAVVSALEPDLVYRATWLDPITGKSTRIGNARPGAAHAWTAPEPPAADQDWLLVLTHGKQ